MSPQKLPGFRVDTRELEQLGRGLGRIARDQGPFAIARGLTELADIARRRVSSNMTKHFKVRNKAFQRNAVFRIPARKTQEPYVARVAVRQWAAFLELQAEGGTKKGAKGHRVTVPSRIVQRTRSGRIRKTQLPRRLRDRKRGLVKSALEQGDRSTITVRRPGGKPGLFYFLKTRVKVPKRWPIRAEVEDTVKRYGATVMKASLFDALRTAKRR